MNTWSLVDHACTCADRSPVYPAMVETHADIGESTCSVYLHRTREGAWAPCAQLNVQSDWERELVGEQYAVSPEALEQAAALACVDLNAHDETFWHQELVTAFRREVDGRVSLRARVADMLDVQDAQVRLAQCRLALVEARLAPDMQTAAWALLPDWTGSPGELIETARALLQQRISDVTAD